MIIHEPKTMVVYVANDDLQEHWHLHDHLLNRNRVVEWGFYPEGRAYIIQFYEERQRALIENQIIRLIREGK